jgi:hypothetical protein
MIENEKDVVAILSHQNDEVKLASIKNIVVDALFSSNGFLNEADLNQFIESSFGILIQKKQLEEAIIKLKQEGAITAESGTIHLNDALFVDMKEKHSDDIKLKEKAISNWVQKYNISVEDKSLFPLIFDCVDAFVNSVFIKHGVISYSLIAGNETANPFEIEAIAKNILENADPRISTLIGDNLKMILASPFDEDTLKYLKNSSKKAVYYLSSIIPENTIHSLEERLKNLVVYLDTNVIYRLLELQGNRRYQDVCDVISFCQDKGVKIKISAKTYEELETTLRWDGRRILQWEIDTALAKRGFELRTDDNYISAFWDATSKTGITARDFNEKYKYPSILIESFNIEIESSTVKTDIISEMASNFTSQLAQDETEKQIETIYHDAYNLAYIRTQQKKNALNAIESGCLFMTSDQSLLRFQKVEPELKSHPICILPSQLLQIFSFNQSRDEYYDTYVNLFSSVSNTYYTTDHDNKYIQEIMGRLSQYKGLDKNVAIKILETELLNSNYTDLTDEERGITIHDAITHSLEKELENKTEKLLTQNKKFNEQVDESTQKISELENSEKKLEKKNDLLMEQIVKSKMNKYILIRSLSLFGCVLLPIVATYCFIVKNPSNIHEYIKYIASILIIPLFIYGYPVLLSKKRKEMYQKYLEEIDI